MAYNAVAVKVDSTGMVSAQQKQPTKWPESLKLYVGKAFEHVQQAQQPLLEQYLKAMVTEAFEKNTVWTTDWAHEPFPDLSQSTTILRDPSGTRPISSTNSVASDTTNSAVSPAQGNTGKRKKSRFDVATAMNEGLGVPGESEAQRAKRAKRFDDLAIKAAAASALVVPSTPSLGYSEGVPDYDEHTIIGHASKLEKSYLRLTSAPDPSTVRPLHVLKQTLDLLKKKWKEDANYAYICDQFKSLRQDLTVQRIKNDFTINVYEIHARIALEKSDLGEYNQCQTQLQSLYSQMPGIGHPLEFLAYRILYMLHTRNLTEINTVLVNLTPALRRDSGIAHALAVRKALACNNHPRLFRLYLEAPNMSGYLMDNFVERERIAAMAVICRGCRPSLDLDARLAKALGFVDEGELVTFLTDLGDDIRASMKPIRPEGSEAPTQYIMDPKLAGDIFEQRKKASAGVDIKGQI